jgi:DNA-binding PadR family transcriptional regulator
VGWREESVRRHLQRLAELGLIEAVEVRRFSRKRKALTSAYVYRVKQGDATPPSRRGAEVRAAERGGRPDLDILLAMSDGALWTITALSVATRYNEKVVRWHLQRLTALNLAEAVEVNDLTTIRLYRITEKGLEALERGQLPPLESALPRGEPELPESGDPVQLAIWLVNWSAIAARVLLHLRSRNGEDSWSNVAVAGGGYRYKVNDGILGAILLRLKELNLVEWRLADPEQPAPRSAHPTRIVHLTERGRKVADAILKLAALLREERAESF